MRQYTERGQGHFIQPAPAIVELCERHGVPYRLADSAETFAAGIGQLGSAARELGTAKQQ
jgi:hypothetical protein